MDVKMLPDNFGDRRIKVKVKLCETQVMSDGSVILIHKSSGKNSKLEDSYTKSKLVYENHKEHSQTTCSKKENINHSAATDFQIVVKEQHSYRSIECEQRKSSEKKFFASTFSKYEKDLMYNRDFTRYSYVHHQRQCLKRTQEFDKDCESESVSESASEKEVRKKEKIEKRWWATADALISGVVVCTLGVGCWRGLWGLMDLHPKIFAAWPCVCAGLTIHLTFTFLRGPLHKHMAQSEVSKIFQWWRCFVGRLYCWVFMSACVLQWRGQWELWVEHVVPNAAETIPFNSQLMTWTGFCALAALRSVRNLLAMPYTVAVDTPASTYNFVTRFRTSSREPFLFVLDCIFSVVVVGSLVVFVWRGAWDLLDYYLFPDDKVWSAWSSAAIGYGLAIITFLLQPLARRACSHFQATRRLLLADLFLFVSFIATINVWRSVWSLLDIYFIPENPLLSNWLTHAGCLLLLILLNCANSVMVRGVYIDAEEDGGQCVVFPCYYLRLFFQKERTKKRQKRLERAAAAALRGDTEGGGLPLVSKLHAGNHVMASIPEKETCLEKSDEN